MWLVGKKNCSGTYQRCFFTSPWLLLMGFSHFQYYSMTHSCFLLCPFLARKEDAVLGSWIVLLMSKSASLLALICFWWALCWAEGSVSHRGECEVYASFLVDVNKTELRGWLLPSKHLVLLLPLSESSCLGYGVICRCKYTFLCSILLLNVK